MTNCNDNPEIDRLFASFSREYVEPNNEGGVACIWCGGEEIPNATWQGDRIRHDDDCVTQRSRVVRKQREVQQSQQARRSWLPWRR